MVTRRTFLKGVAASGLISSSSTLPVVALAKGSAMKIGYISPRTGPLAAFAEADTFVLEGIKVSAKAQGLNIEGIVKDSQSNANRATKVANELIGQNKGNLMLNATTRETTNAIASTCAQD